MGLLCTLKGIHKRGICQLAFNSDGTQICSVGLDNNHSIVTYACVAGPDGHGDWGGTTSLKYTAKGITSKVLGLSFIPGDDAKEQRVVSYGVRHMLFWEKKGRSIASKKGIFGKIGGQATVLCSAFLKNELITGTNGGELLRWSTENRKCVQKVDHAHEGPVYALVTTPSGDTLVSGGKDGVVKLWSFDAEGTRLKPMPLQSFSLNGLLFAGATVDGTAGAPQRAVSSLDVSADSARLLIGTKDSEIFELALSTGLPMQYGRGQEGEVVKDGMLVDGHCKDELWGLAMHPKEPDLFATCGDDNTVRVWSISGRKMIASINVKHMARALAFSPDGRLLVAGLGGRVGRQRVGKKNKLDGAVVVLEVNANVKCAGSAGYSPVDGGKLAGVTLKKRQTIKDARDWISEVKFSPNGQNFAVGSHDNNIYLYSARGGALQAKCKGHNSYITHIDWSDDGRWLQSNCGAYELLFWNAADGKQEKSATKLRDIAWHTWTCTLGWPVQGIWPPCADGTDVNAVDRSPGPNHSVVATADDFGMVKLFRYPCLEKGSPCIEYRGHSSHVTNIRFGLPESAQVGGAPSYPVLSCGGNDRCVFQWQYEEDEKQTDARSDTEKAEAKAEMEMDRGESKGFDDDGQGGGDDDADDLFDAVGGGDEFMAVKPWVGAIKAPSTVPIILATAPECDLELEWVHGYAAQSSRNNLRYTRKPDTPEQIVYHAAALGVVLNPKEKGSRGASNFEQKFHEEHTDDIVCLAVHPTENIVATGQLGKKPIIVVWDVVKQKTLQVLTGFHKRAVRLLAFSTHDGGRHLASIGDDNEHSIAIYRWEQNSLVASSKGDKATNLALCFNPSAEKAVTFAECGVKHINFWTMQGRNLDKKKGLMGTKGKLQPLIDLAFVGGDAVVGTKDGSIYRFKKHKVNSVVKAHEGECKSLWATTAESAAASGGVALVSGGKDGKIKLWDADIKPLRTLDLNVDRLGSVMSGLASVCMSEDGRRILAGTMGSEIFELNADAADDDTRAFAPVEGRQTAALVSGHCAKELWGLAVHPDTSTGLYCTVGDDKTVRIWDLTTKTQYRCEKLPTLARAVAYDPEGRYLAVGLGGDVGRGRNKLDGAFVILDGETLESLFKGHDSKQWISDVKFSPVKKGGAFMLAVGSHDNNIYLYEVKDRGGKVAVTLKHTCKGHNSYITHIDWSADGRWMQSNCGAYELLFWDADTGKQQKHASAMKDVQWHTWTCTLGWPVQGIWPPCADGTDVNAVDRSKSEKHPTVLVTADDFGKVKLFRYPCVIPGANNNVERGHSSHVTNVRWMSSQQHGEDSHVLSCGGNDRCVFQWKNVKEEEETAEAYQGETKGEEDSSFSTAPLGGGGEDDDIGDAFEFAASAGGDEFMAVKPWVGAIKPPSSPLSSNPKKPKDSMKPAASWVFGYRSQDTRSNLAYTSRGHIVYHTAAVGIVFHIDEEEGPTTSTQNHFLGHDDDILCQDLDPAGLYVATGQTQSAHRRKEKPVVHVWDANTCAQLCTLGGFHKRAILCLRFSDNGKKLVSIGADDDHSVAVWTSNSGTWTDGTLQVRGR